MHHAHKGLPSNCTLQLWKEKGMVNTFACSLLSLGTRDIVKKCNYGVQYLSSKQFDKERHGTSVHNIRKSRHIYKKNHKC
jgi:hypothetical protein